MTDTIKDYSAAQWAIGFFYRAISHSRETDR